MIAFFILGFGLLFYGIFLLFYPKLLTRHQEWKLEKPGKKNPNIAVIIPARDESKVIEGLLNCLEHQTVFIPPQNIYVIVEQESDSTVSIVKKHQMNVFVRQKLDLKTKGYAIQELIEDLDQKKKYYDCYFFFDADNLLEDDFFEKMLEDYRKGYAVSTGYRALKNKDKVFPVSAGLTFYLVNEVRNQISLKQNGSILLSGTGYYLNGKYIKKWKTFPFHSLTEDYESSLYYTLEGITTHYREDACFYDEQPETYAISLKQRSRWIKGYFTNWFTYRPLLRQKRKEHPSNYASLLDMEIGISPVIYMILGFVFLLVFGFFTLPVSFEKRILLFLIAILLVYFLLFLITVILLWIAHKKMTLKFSVFLGVLFYHPIFLISYVHALWIAMMHKNLGWEKIPRQQEIINSKKN